MQASSAFSTDMHDIIITGASGYIGRHAALYFAEKGLKVLGLSRHPVPALVHQNVSLAVVPGYAAPEWKGDALFTKHAVVIHTAARAHHPGEKDGMQARYRAENVDLTLRLARLAQREGCRRFIFISSIGAALAEKDLEAGKDRASLWRKHPYRISKLEAEEQLAHMRRETGFDVLSLRLPMVYGKNAPGNIQKLLTFIKHGMPLPLASVDNRRAFIAIDNVLDFLSLATSQQIIPPLCSIRDGDEISTPEFIRALAAALGLRAFLLPCPVMALKLLGHFTGRAEQIESLTESLSLDLRPVSEKTGWKPLFGTREGLMKAYAQQ